MRRNIYVRPEDQAIWAEAERLARERGEGLSPLIAEALREYVAKRHANLDAWMDSQGAAT